MWCWRSFNFSRGVITSYSIHYTKLYEAKEIDVGVDVALEKFEKEVGGAKQFLESAKGLLVFPSVIKAGIGFGGEYGEGALRIGGKSVAYYNTIAGSFGFQLA